MAKLFIDWARENHPVSFMDRILATLDPEGDRFEWLVTGVQAHLVGNIDEDGSGHGWLLEREYSAPTFELVRALTEVRPQYGFAVFSAFLLAEAPDPNFLPTYPYADGNGDLWLEETIPQHPKALFELVAWDNTYTMAICREDRWLSHLKRCFPDALENDPLA